MTHTIAESEVELQRVFQAWPDADSASRPALMEKLKSLLGELWENPDRESLRLRRQVRAFIDEAEHRGTHMS